MQIDVFNSFKAKESCFLLRCPVFMLARLAENRPLRQVLLASSATGGASETLPPTSPAQSVKRTNDIYNVAVQAKNNSQRKKVTRR